MAKNRNHHLIKRGDTWYLQKYVQGKWIKKTLSTSVTEARRQRNDHLRNLEIYGDIDPPQELRGEPNADPGPLFGEVAERWARIKTAQIKGSTMRDYRSSMNLHVLPRFGNRPIRDISYLEIEEFKADLKRSPKRTNNILVPIRSVFSMAFKEGIVEDNVMLKVDNLRADDPSIHPLSLEEALKVIDAVDPHYRNCLITLFFTGLRFGELAALKWHNVDLDRKTARICETLVYGVEGRPKTKKSNRDIDLLPPVMEALRDQKERTQGRSPYVFLDNTGHPLNPDHVRKVIWIRALKKAGVDYRPLMQTRHTFATLMLSEGENIGWIQNMLGHSSLQMIFTKYYSWIPRKTRNDGSAFMRAYEAVDSEESGPELVLAEQPAKVVDLKKEAQKRPIKKKGVNRKPANPLNLLVAGGGFEPPTFGL